MLRVWTIVVSLTLASSESIAAIPPKVCVYDTAGATASERLLMASVMGIVNKTAPEIYLGPSLWIQELLGQSPTTQIEQHTGVTWFMSRYKARFAGYILCDQNTWNEAASVAGVLAGIIVDTTTQHYATDVGLSMLLDIRGKNAAWVYNNYGSRLSRDYLFSQFTTADHHLRDFAILKNGFMFYEPPAVETYYANQNAGTWAFGWGPSEYNFFSRASRHGLFGVAADWLQGASATSQWNVPIPRQSTHTPATVTTDPTAHYVAFVMSDGDNVQFLTNSFYNDPWFGSPHRGSFDMTWDICPALKDVNSLAMRYYYASASSGTHKDFFVNAGGPGLIYPSESPDISAFVTANSAAMAATDLNIISILDNTFDSAKIDAILADPQVTGAMLKVGDAYKGMKGAIHWYNGKPCVTVKYSLWEGFDTASSLVTALNNAAHDPLHDQNSYSIVNVHPWSPDPMGNVATVAGSVAGHVRIATLEELMVHLRNNFGAPLGYGLRGEYYDDLAFGSFKRTRVDPNINYNWGEGAPDPTVGPETFSVRWTGMIEPQYSEEYTFHTVTDDGVRLWINNQLVINNWTDHGTTENSGRIRLTAGQRYPIKLEFYDNRVAAMVTLSWSSAGQAKQIIPPQRLTPCSPDGALPAGWLSLDVGSPWLAGCAQETAGAFSLMGAGSGTSGNQDSFHYVHIPWSYDGEIIARVTGIEDFAPQATVGLMMRSTTDADSPFIMAAATASGAAFAQGRTTTAAMSSAFTGGSLPPPGWLKLIRDHGLFTAQTSPDGRSWTTLTTQAIAMPREIAVGFAVYSGTDPTLSRATADNLQFVPYAPGDFDHDSDVDQSDFAHLQACFSTSLSALPPAGCDDARLDGDTDVDQADLAVFKKCLSGSGIPANPDCAK